MYKTFSILGLPIYSLYNDYETSDRTQKFFGGLISTFRAKRDFGNYVEKDIKIFGKSFLKRIDDGISRTYYFAERPVKKFFLYQELKPLCKMIGDKHDDVYILNANSGEIYLFLTYVVDAVFRKNGSKSPLFIATKKYHCDMIEMLCPEVPYIYQKNAGKKIAAYSFNIEKLRFFMIFDHAHFKRVEARIKKNPAGSIHYFDEMLKRCEISKDDVVFRNVAISKDIENSMMEKVRSINLNLDKFVFLAPEAMSCEMLDNSFWTEIVKCYRNKGYDVFLNLISPMDLECEYKTCFLTYSEAFALAKLSKKIISLRSGFTELLTQTNVPMDILFTKFGGRSSIDDMTIEQVYEGFNVLKLSRVNNSLIKEYCANSYNINAL